MTARQASVLVVASAVTWAVVGTGLRGPDYPAQLYRVGLFHRAGYTIWDSGWYSGHYTLGYSMVFPPLAATFGLTAVAVVSTLASILLFGVLARRLFPAAAIPAMCWVAFAMTVNLLVGRLTFALGVAVGLGALLCLLGDRRLLAIGSAALTSMASPVAGFFLALVVIALGAARGTEQRSSWWSPRVRTPLLMAMAAAVPVVVPAILFPTPGVFPFPIRPALGVIVTGVGIVVLAPKRHRFMRMASVLMVAVAIALFVVANPVGGNLIRLPTMFAWPVLAGALWSHRRNLVVLAALPLSVWLVYPVAASTASYRSPSSVSAYYQPLVSYLEGADGPPGRVEVPFTAGHWEAAYVAPHVRLARGWERQTDMARNGLFYDGTFDAASYRRWLDREAVRWIALPDTGIDQGGRAEVALLGSDRPSWLRPVWHDAHWTVFEVVDATPMVEAPGRAVAADATGLDLIIDRPGTVLVHETYNPYWKLTGLRGCLRESADGLTVIEAAEAGRAHLRATFSVAAVGSSTSSCATADR